MPRPQSSAEDDGWILAPVFRAAKSTTDLVILDAQDLSKGPIATIHLPHHIPIGGELLIASIACQCPCCMELLAGVKYLRASVAGLLPPCSAVVPLA